MCIADWKFYKFSLLNVKWVVDKIPLFKVLDQNAAQNILKIGVNQIVNCQLISQKKNRKVMGGHGVNNLFILKL